MRRIPVQTAYNWVLAMFRHGRIRAATATMSAQAAGGSRPSPVSNGLNGLQALSFDGTHDHLVSTTFVLENAHSIYAVAKSG